LNGFDLFSYLAEKNIQIEIYKHMKVSTYIDLQTKYSFSETELNCIFLNMAINNQEIAYAGTIGKVKKSKSMQNAGNYFFNKLEVKRFIHEQKDLVLLDNVNKSEPKIKTEQTRTNNTEKDKSLFSLGDTTELTKENIKQVLELEFSKISDPEKRTALLIRIADLLSLQNSNNNEVEKPLIYLPNIEPETV